MTFGTSQNDRLFSSLFWPPPSSPSKPLLLCGLDSEESLSLLSWISGPDRTTSALASLRLASFEDDSDKPLSGFIVVGVIITRRTRLELIAKQAENLHLDALHAVSTAWQIWLPAEHTIRQSLRFPSQILTVNIGAMP